MSNKENNMDCNKCKSKEYCEYKKNGQVCPFPNFSNYIRKDALLEFLARLEKDSARNAGTDDLAYAAHEMVCMLIDKIESL